MCLVHHKQHKESTGEGDRSSPLLEGGGQLLGRAQARKARVMKSARGIAMSQLFELARWDMSEEAALRQGGF
eukprot:3851871-Amphidinium_carterae.2